jgi:hypothetical protein
VENNDREALVVACQCGRVKVYREYKFFSTAASVFIANLFSKDVDKVIWVKSPCPDCQKKEMAKTPL